MGMLVLAALILILVDKPAAHFMTSTARVGTADWLVKLSKADLSEIRALCPLTTNSPSVASLNPHHRIVNGDLSSVEEFKAAASLVGLEKKAYYNGCGATFITRRHMLTAGHCVNSEELSINPMAGGVYVCTHDRIEPDFAIIQLREPVPDHLWRSRISVDCLPLANTALPTTVTVRGWGLLRMEPSFWVGYP
jgi:hypothetical protein